MDTGTIINIGILVLVVWFAYSRFKPAKGLRNLNAEEFKSHMGKPGKPLVIDVREPNEYKGGYIADAKNIPLSQLSRRLSEIPQDRDVLLYCRSGMRSKSAAKILLKNGHKEIAHLQGGIGAWKGKLASK
ncbi:sulfurtransferase [Paenibacillus sp. VTT E-133280]|uniref:Rhodanese-like domain-containing protein n=2 Tax=Paenibacillaceae TaxID=186822 RepID=A0A7Z2VT92_9BACL|nr:MULTISPECIES: rhodanese-like domain-containing protein [Paenibacillus]QJD88560.1 rhodanese-like domain-containing protein [Cohnella herbarum]KKC47787.1 sulfurtransferase [Paenibacillus sp. D9]MCK8487469.1 rhodanese-like domain-containing protein [Paenibacillus mellifer]MCT1400916.1 rhodanese-like domain-containing protein [Paenibacillus sp. p3-SID867]MEC0259846.1 rhodanese-like domain-containing protein [Paenibacillus lautus]